MPSEPEISVGRGFIDILGIKYIYSVRAGTELLISKPEGITAPCFSFLEIIPFCLCLREILSFSVSSCIWFFFSFRAQDHIRPLKRDCIGVSSTQSAQSP